MMASDGRTSRLSLGREQPERSEKQEERSCSVQHSEAQMTPQQHAQRIEQMLQQARQECRDDIGRVSDPKAQALFETTAEALGGLCKALNDYQQGSEAVWRTSSL